MEYLLLEYWDYERYRDQYYEVTTECALKILQENNQNAEVNNRWESRLLNIKTQKGDQKTC